MMKAPLIGLSLMLLCLHMGAAFSAEAPGTPPQDQAIREVVRVANKFIKHGPCQPSLAEPSVVATMSPYTPEVRAGRAAAQYAVLWSGDIDCRGGSGTHTMNFLLVEKSGAAAARIVGVDSIDGAASVERIVAATPDTLTIDVYTWAPDDSTCCPSRYERWTLRREPGVAKYHYTLRRVASQPAQPVPLPPGQKKLPTAMLDP
jgi:hypothetical protein